MVKENSAVFFIIATKSQTKTHRDSLKLMVKENSAVFFIIATKSQTKTHRDSLKL